MPRKKNEPPKEAPAKTSTKKKGSIVKDGSAISTALAFMEEHGISGMDQIVDLDPDKFKEVQPHISSGSFIIDMFIGGPPNKHGVVPYPGFPRGKIVNLYGHEASGKTTLALETAAGVCAKGGNVVYIDWENEVVPTYAAKLGVPIGNRSKFVLVQPESLEEGFRIAYVMVCSGVDLVVLDSIGAAVPQAAIEKSVKEVTDNVRIGHANQFWSTKLPLLKTKLQKSGSVLLAISQMRSNIQTSGYGGDGMLAQGGNPWKFYPALRLRLQRISTEKAKVYSPIDNTTKDVVVGSVVRIKADKCKISPQQGNDALFYIRYGEGIDNLRSLIEVGTCHKIITKGGAWYSWTTSGGKEIRTQGVEKFREIIINDPSLFGELEAQVRQAVFKSYGQVTKNHIVEEDDDESSIEDEILRAVGLKKVVDDEEEEDEEGDE